MKPSTKSNLAILAILVAFGVLGRWLQPQWSFTPAVGIAVFAGYFFANRVLAALAPVAVLAISNLLLPSYDGFGVMAIVYLSLIVPVALGRWLARDESYGRLAVCGLAPAVLFFFSTNFAVWCFHSWYPHTLAGLGACYAAALPFFRWMVLGDVFYVALLFGSYALAVQSGRLPERRKLQPVRVRSK